VTILDAYTTLIGRFHPLFEISRCEQHHEQTEERPIVRIPVL